MGCVVAQAAHDPRELACGQRRWCVIMPAMKFATRPGIQRQPVETGPEIERPVTLCGLQRPRPRWALMMFVSLPLCVGSVAFADNHTGAGSGSTQTVVGAEVFLKYCAGCHGENGFADYEHAPSFSMGERLHKRDSELLTSILRGKHGMPYWENKLSVDMFRSAIAYLRVMEQRYSSGLPPREEPLPEHRYKFKPVGEEQHYWERQQE